VGEPIEPPPVSPARGPPTEWGELVPAHFRPRRRPDLARRSAGHRHPFTLTRPQRGKVEPACAEPRKPCLDSGFHGRLRPSFASQDSRKTGPSTIGYAQKPTSRQRPGAELPLTVLSFGSQRTSSMPRSFSEQRRPRRRHDGTAWLQCQSVLYTLSEDDETNIKRRFDQRCFHGRHRGRCTLLGESLRIRRS